MPILTQTNSLALPLSIPFPTLSSPKKSSEDFINITDGSTVTSNILLDRDDDIDIDTDADREHVMKSVESDEPRFRKHPKKSITAELRNELENNVEDCLTPSSTASITRQSTIPKSPHTGGSDVLIFDHIRSPTRTIRRSVSLSSDFISPPDDSHLGVGFNRPSAIVAPPLSLKMSPDKKKNSTIVVVDLTRRSPRILSGINITIPITEIKKITQCAQNDIQKGMKKILSPSDHDLVTPPIILPITLPVTVLAADPAPLKSVKIGTKRNVKDITTALIDNSNNNNNNNNNDNNDNNNNNNNDESNSSNSSNSNNSSSSNSNHINIRSEGKKAKLIGVSSQNPTSKVIKGSKAVKAPINLVKESNGSGGNIMNFFASKK